MKKTIIGFLVVSVVCFLIVCGFVAVISITTRKCGENYASNNEKLQVRHIAVSQNSTDERIAQVKSMFRQAKLKLLVKGLINKAGFFQRTQNQYQGEAFINLGYLFKNKPITFLKLISVSKARRTGSY